MTYYFCCSVFGTFATLFCIIAIVFLSFMEVRNSQKSLTYKIFDFSGVPIALATISFSYGGNNVFPQIEESMQKPRHWNRVATAALCTCAAMYSLVAFSGYLAYGDETKSPILDNLPEGKEK
jgi:vesicular inhibitory amino acid transporter